MSADSDLTVTHAGLPPADPTATVGFGAVPVVAAPPAVVPGFSIDRELGRGGMGVVYLATQDGLNRQVALKMVLSGEHASATDKGRFLAEAEAVAAVRHPGVVQVFGFGTHDGRPYFALEFLSGGSLADRLKGTPLPAAEAADLVARIAAAVQAAHDAGVIHRDLKPANILFDADGSPKVTDFGLARKEDSASGLTATGAILGTPSYMSPEQAEGRKDVGPPADVYALGAVLYECLTGRPPFRAATALETVLQVMNDEPVPPSRLTPKLPRDLETVAVKCLAKDPRKRYPSAGAVADDLKRYLTGEPILARPVSAVERGWRWVRRNPLLAAVTVGGPALLAGTVVVVLIALLMTAVANVRLAAERQNADNQKAEAEHQRKLAQARLEKAIAAVDQMVTRVGSERWTTDPALQDERRQVLEEAVAFFDGFTGDDTTDPQLRRETAKAYTRLAGAYLMLGEMGKSADATAAAGRVYDGLTAEFPDDPEYLAAAAEVHSLAGNAAALRAQYADALQEYTRAVELADAARGRSPDSPRYKLRAVEARAALGYFYLQADRTKGERLVGPMLEQAREVGTSADAGYEYRVALAFALTVGAAYDFSRGDPPAAAAKYEEAGEVLDGLTAMPATSARARDQSAQTRAIVTIQRGYLITMAAAADDRRREGVKQMRAGVDQFDALLKVYPKAFPYRLQKFQALRLLAVEHTALRETAEAAALTAAADKLIDEMLRENPNLEWLVGLDAFRNSAKLVERVRADDALAFESEAEGLLTAGRQRRQWDTVYNVACTYAVAAGRRPAAADGHAAKAVALLNELVERHYFRVRQRVDHLGTDTDLDALRGRDDFKAFVARVKNPPADLPRPK